MHPPLHLPRCSQRTGLSVDSTTTAYRLRGTEVSKSASLLMVPAPATTAALSAVAICKHEKNLLAEHFLSQSVCLSVINALIPSTPLKRGYNH